jgi:hypothetical protein
LYRSRKPGQQDLLVNSNYGKFSYLVNLYTKSNYEERFIKPYNAPGKTLIVVKGEIRPFYPGVLPAVRSSSTSATPGASVVKPDQSKPRPPAPKVEAIRFPPPVVVPADLFPQTDISKEDYLKGATIWIKNKAGKYETKKYDEMTEAEKAALPPVPNLRYPKQTPESPLLAEWKTRTDEVRIDNKTVKNSSLANYKPEDFSWYKVTSYKPRPGTAAYRTYGTRVITYMQLYTNSYYEEKIAKPRYAPGKILTLNASYGNSFYWAGIPTELQKHPADKNGITMIVFPLPAP